jgi:hypothetical protein
VILTRFALGAGGTQFSDLRGRSANIAAWLPYGVGTFQGSVLGTDKQIYRSGLFDSGCRLSVNLKGGPAMPMSQFAKWKQTVVLGASLKVIAPTGQYDPTKLINWGINRWAFKPEFGYSQRFKEKWILDGYGGAVFFTTNQEFFSIPTPQPQTKSIRRSPELRREALPREDSTLVLARWQFLVRGNNEYGGQIKPGYQADGFPRWSHSSHSGESPPVDQSEL